MLVTDAIKWLEANRDKGNRLARAAGDHEDYTIDLALEMIRLRESLGLTQAQVAERLGVKQGAIAKLESATTEHRVDSIMRYLAALDASLVVGIQPDQAMEVRWVTQARPTYSVGVMTTVPVTPIVDAPTALVVKFQYVAGGTGVGGLGTRAARPAASSGGARTETRDDDPFEAAV